MSTGKNFFQIPARRHLAFGRREWAFKKFITLIIYYKKLYQKIKYRENKKIL